MKKLLLCLCIALSMVCVSAQVMPSNGVKNTIWTGFGTPDSKKQDVSWYGITNTLQARVDIAQFTMEGMINWGLFTTFNCGGRRIEYTDKTAFYAVSRISDDYSTQVDDSTTDPYYVNFLWHPANGLSLGVGTNLQWKVGPAPSCNDYYWGQNAHIKQGGLKYNRPGFTDVAGYVHYPNVYSTSLYNYFNGGAIGLRYQSGSLFEVGLAIPSGTSTNNFSFNTGVKVQPLDFFNISFAYEGVCKDEGHLYLGGQFIVKRDFLLNLYMAIDNLGGNKDIKNGITGLGVSAEVHPRSSSITFKPEFGITFFENKDYTSAINFGTTLDYAVSSRFSLGTWLSFAFGSRNLEWEKHELSKEYVGGTVFDIRPQASLRVNSNNSVSLYADYQSRYAFNNVSYSAWAAGFYWTFTN